MNIVQATTLTMAL